MKYKAIAFDIDGTLTNSEKIITEETKNSIELAMKKGCVIMIASGRPIKGLWKFADELKLKQYGGYILSFNGGKIYDCKAEKIIYDAKVPIVYYKEIYELAKKHKVTLLSYKNDSIISENIDDEYLNIEAKIIGMDKIKTNNLYKSLDYEVNKFLMTADGDYLAEVEKDVYKHLHDRMEIYRSEPFFLELLPKGINKAETLKWLIGKIGIKKEELMAFGDGYNDISMISYAGLGVAMANGRKEVLAVADYIAKSNDDNGIVDVLHKFVID